MSAFFAYGELKQVKLPNALNEIGSRVFSDCHSLESIVIPDSVEEIGDRVTCFKFYNIIALN